MLEAYLHHNPKLAPSAWVHEFAVVIGHVELASEVSIWPGAILRGDQGSIRIGTKSNIQDGTVVHATQGLSNTSVGERVTVGHNAVLHGCTIGSDCLIGMGAIILDNAIIGDGCIVGAGALILKDTVVPPGSLVLGNPAREFRTVTEQQKLAIKEGWQAYVRLANEYRGKTTL
jgi:carbonic anhydrase/acetyltransferase-like protein (isoleucine patch superfamily)